MAFTVPTIEPRNLIAGETATWLITLEDFPATDWTLGYALVKRGGAVKIAIAATASGSDHLVSETPTATAQWEPGTYDVQATVTHSSTGERHSVKTFTLTLLADFNAQENGYDARSQARKIFDQIETAIQTGTHRMSITTVGSGTITEWQAEGLRVKRSSNSEVSLGLTELVKLRDRYAAIVRNEDEKAARASGKGTGRRILTRFTTP